MQTTAIRTVTNSLPENEVILLTLLISKRYIPLYRFFVNLLFRLDTGKEMLYVFKSLFKTNDFVKLSFPAFYLFVIIFP